MGREAGFTYYGPTGIRLVWASFLWDIYPEMGWIMQSICFMGLIVVVKGGARIVRGQSVGISRLFNTWIQGIKLSSTALVANILTHWAI